MPGRPFSFFNFKGTPSREEHKTILSIFTTIELASTGRVEPFPTFPEILGSIPARVILIDSFHDVVVVYPPAYANNGR